MLPRSGALRPPTTEVTVDNQMAIITSFNVSDPDATVVLTMEPNKDVILRLLLAAGSSPNETMYEKEVFLTSKGKSKHLHTWLRLG